jgi:hypothetical protein
MTRASPPSEDRYAHLRVHAMAQKQTTVERLKQAITQLETEGREVSTFTIKEVSGLDYMVYYRNSEALALFRTHSTHLREERVKEEAKQQQTTRKKSKRDDRLHQVKVEPRDPLLAYKKPELVAKLRAVYTERDQIKQHAQAEVASLEQRYTTLLQAHLQCGITIAKLEAQVAEYGAFLERFRSSLQREEHS